MTIERTPVTLLLPAGLTEDEKELIAGMANSRMEVSALDFDEHLAAANLRARGIAIDSADDFGLDVSLFTIEDPSPGDDITASDRASVYVDAIAKLRGAPTATGPLHATEETLRACGLTSMEIRSAIENMLRLALYEVTGELKHLPLTSHLHASATIAASAVLHGGAA